MWGLVCTKRVVVVVLALLLLLGAFLWCCYLCVRSTDGLWVLWKVLSLNRKVSLWRATTTCFKLWDHFIESFSSPATTLKLTGKPHRSAEERHQVDSKHLNHISSIILKHFLRSRCYRIDVTQFFIFVKHYTLPEKRTLHHGHDWTDQ